MNDIKDWNACLRVTPVIDQGDKNICLINALNGVCESIWMIDDKKYNKDSVNKAIEEYRLSTKEFMDNVFVVLKLTPEESRLEPWNEEEFRLHFRTMSMERAFEYLSRAGVSLERDCPFRNGEVEYPIHSRPNPREIVWSMGMVVGNETWSEEKVNSLLDEHPMVGGVKLYASFDLLYYKGNDCIYDGPELMEYYMEKDVERRIKLHGGLPIDKKKDTYEEKKLRKELQKWVPGLHAVLLVGYGISSDERKKYFIIRNSYSGRWGCGGYMRVPRSFITHITYPKEVYYPKLVSYE